MASKLVKFELNGEGVRELLKSGEMQSILEAEGSNKASQAGEGYASSVHVGKNRAYCNIYPNTQDAYYDNLDNNTLEKVIRS